MASASARILRRMAISAALVWALLLAAAGCGGNYIDPGANPARLEVSITAYPQTQLRRHGKSVLWDWGLFLVDPQSGWAALPPESGARLTAQAANPLERKLVFLVPPGQRRLALKAEGYILRQQKEHLVPYVVAYHLAYFDLNLKPGQTLRLKKRFAR